MRSKIILTILLFLFSILYLKESSNFIKENDPLMIEIKNKQNIYNIEPINAIITKNTMIPGINGKKVNLNKTYKKMKKINTFNDSLIVFDTIKPNKSINNIYNKVIVSGNKMKRNISIIVNTKDNILNEINTISNDFNVNLTLSNNYCITYNLKINNNCIKKHQYTILGHLINRNFLNQTKELVQNGIIFVYVFNKTNYQELNIILKYLKNNNYNIVSIDKLIVENE